MKKLVMEYAYSFRYALEKFSDDADAELFLSTLDGEISEDVYHAQGALIRAVLSMAKRIDSSRSRNKVPTGDVPRAAFMKGLTKLLPGKTEEQLSDLSKHLDGSVHYPTLFEEDRQGKSSARGAHCV